MMPITLSTIGGEHTVFTSIGENTSIQHQPITPPTPGYTRLRTGQQAVNAPTSCVPMRVGYGR
jgi:hypothetical protein